jgi:glycosyltransferase involved in cell wall biosynthesis
VLADRFRARDRRQSSVERTVPFRVVLSGSLESFNGLELVTAAMTHLPGEYELVIAGSGSLEGFAREQAARDPRIRFLGFLAFEDVLELYWSADLLLNARITRAIDTRYFFPSKLMELLASGTPVLSTCTGHVESEYGHVLYLLRDETPEALAARMEEIRRIAPRERFDLGRRAREFMLTEKTWRRQGERLADYMRREVLGLA